MRPAFDDRHLAVDRVGAEQAVANCGDQLGDDHVVTGAEVDLCKATRLLVERHQDRVFNAAFYMLGDEEDAEDVTQDVFLKAYEGLGSFRGEAKFGTWLYGIMLNLVRNLFRRRGRRPSRSSRRCGWRLSR